MAILGIASALIIHPNYLTAQNPETENSSNTFQNETMAALLDDPILLDSSYTPDQINEIIYHLFQEIQNPNFATSRNAQDISILIDFICSNESIETAVEACDVVSELPID